MKRVINPKNLTPDDTWPKFRKVRAIIENEQGCFAISIEGGKCIFPGGKCDKDEDDVIAIQREIKEETGIDIPIESFTKILEIESIYDDIKDYRTNTIGPRYTFTTCYYAKTNKKINADEMNLTDGEIKENFKISFVNIDTLAEMITKDYDGDNAHMFKDENVAILGSEILKGRIK